MRRPSVVSGFTLIELLVTVAVIAVLIGLATFGIRHTRGTAVELRCLTTQRSIAQQMHRYAADHSGRVPAVALDVANGPSEVPSTQVAWTSIPTYLLRSQMWRDYSGSNLSPGELMCPATPSDLAVDPWTVSDFAPSASLYMDSRYLDPALPESSWRSQTGERLARLEDVAFPADKAMLYEWRIRHNWPGAKGGDSASLFHYSTEGSRRRGSVAFIDGHGESLAAAEIPWVNRYPVWRVYQFSATPMGIAGRDRPASP